jgi:hypothetical protein
VDKKPFTFTIALGIYGLAYNSVMAEGRTSQLTNKDVGQLDVSMKLQEDR